MGRKPTDKKYYFVKIERGNKIIFDTKIKNNKALKKAKLEQSEDEFYDQLFQTICIVFLQNPNEKTELQEGDEIIVDGERSFLLDNKYIDLLKISITRTFDIHKDGKTFHDADIKRISVKTVVTEEQFQDFHKLNTDDKIEFLSLFVPDSRANILETYDKRLPKEKFDMEDFKEYEEFVERAKSISTTPETNPDEDKINAFLLFKKVINIWNSEDFINNLKSHGKKTADTYFDTFERFVAEEDLPEDYYAVKKEVLDHFIPKRVK